MKDKETKGDLRSYWLMGSRNKNRGRTEGQQTTLVYWERDFKEEGDNLQAVELEAMHDKFCRSAFTRVEFFWEVLSWMQERMRNGDLSGVTR